MPGAEHRACRPTWTIECTAAEIAETKRQNGAPRAGCRKLSMETGCTIERTAAERQTSEAAAGRHTPGLNERRRSTAVANGETKQGRD